MNKTDSHENRFKYPIHSVENAFSLLEALADNRLELRIAEICKKIALPKGTVHRLLGTLKNLGYIEQNSQNRKYYLTVKIFELGTAVTDKIGLVQIIPYMKELSDKIGLVQIIPYMKELSQEFNETVNLAILDRDEITYLYSIGSDNTLRLDLKIGSNQPAYCAAVGKELANYLERVKLKSYTPYTITSKEYLKKDLKLIRERGYSFVNEEYMQGVSCVAVPLRDQQGKVCVGLSFSVPTVRMDKEKMPQLIDSLISTAKKINMPRFF